MVRTAASLHLMHESLVSWVSPCWNWGCGLETTFLYLLLLSGCRGPRSPRPHRAPSSTVIPTRGYQEGTPFWHRRIHGAKPGRHPRPWTLKKLPLLLGSTSNWFLALGPTMLTLVNAWGPYGTSIENKKSKKMRWEIKIRDFNVVS